MEFYDKKSNKFIPSPQLGLQSLKTTSSAVAEGEKVKPDVNICRKNIHLMALRCEQISRASAIKTQLLSTLRKLADNSVEELSIQLTCAQSFRLLNDDTVGNQVLSLFV